MIKCYGEKLGYGSKNSRPELKRYTRLLFVSAYFKILFDFILKTNPTEVRKNPKILDPIFKNFEANDELLKFTDEAMQNYFINAEFYYSDFNDEEGKNVTWHNFFEYQNPAPSTIGRRIGRLARRPKRYWDRRVNDNTINEMYYISISINMSVYVYMY